MTKSPVLTTSEYEEYDDFATKPLDEAGLLILEAVPSGRTWDDAINDLLALRNLQDDWDGQGVIAPGSAIVDSAISLAQTQLFGQLPADRVIAGGNGNIIFEWHTPDGYREIEVTSPHIAEERFLRRGSKIADSLSLRW